jgi:lysophospholipase L1-like esterase
VGQDEQVSGPRKLLLAAGLIILVVAIGSVPVPVPVPLANWRAPSAPLTGCPLLRKVYAHTVTSANHGSISALIIGDSWSAGLGLHDTDVTVATWLAADAGWNARIDAFSGSGFVNTTVCGDEKYAGRTSKLRVNDQNLVFQGGLNDVNTAGQVSQLAGDAADAIAKAAARAPATAIIVVGPPIVPARSAALVRAADADLATVCKAAGVTYVSTLGWQGEMQPDGLHPSAAGAKSYAAYVTARLR